MRNTVLRALSERPIARDEDVIPMLNKELIPLVREMRIAHNLEARQQYSTGTVGNGVFTTVWVSDPLRVDDQLHVHANVVARSTSGPAGSAAYLRAGLFVNTAGVVSQVGATTDISTIESAPGCDVQFAVSGQTVLFQVKDDGVSTYAWKATVTVLGSNEP